jgi:hypothetical protein
MAMLAPVSLEHRSGCGNWLDNLLNRTNPMSKYTFNPACKPIIRDWLNDETTPLKFEAGLWIAELEAESVGNEKHWAQIMAGLLHEVDPLIDPTHAAHLPSTKGEQTAESIQ